MTETLLTRLERYGDDLDRAADVGTPGRMDDDDTSHRRGGVLAFAAACVVLAGMAAVLLIGGGGSGEQPVADESAPTTSDLPEPITESLVPVFAGGFPTEEFSETITLESGFVVEVSFVEPSFSVGSQAYGDPGILAGGSSIIDRDMYEDGTFSSPLITGMSFGGDFPGRRPLVTYVGATGANVSRVEMTDETGLVHAVNTVAIDDFPGIRVWGLTVQEGVSVVRHVYLSDDGAVLRDESSCRVVENWVIERSATARGEGEQTDAPTPEERAASEQCRSLN